MPKTLDKILVIDIEATCWESKTPPAGQESEIIEIGICPVDIRRRSQGDAISIMVKPERSKVSSFCTELTTITQELADTGIPFAQACRRLEEEYGSRERIWASFGDYDRNQFERQCRATGIRYPFGSRHINIKTLFAVAFALPAEVGMPGALKRLRFSGEGTHHRAGDDASNIARILCELLRRWPISSQAGV